jgi:hypothetical protein
VHGGDLRVDQAGQGCPLHPHPARAPPAPSDVAVAAPWFYAAARASPRYISASTWHHVINATVAYPARVVPGQLHRNVIATSGTVRSSDSWAEQLRDRLERCFQEHTPPPIIIDSARPTRAGADRHAWPRCMTSLRRGPKATPLPRDDSAAPYLPVHARRSGTSALRNRYAWRSMEKSEQFAHPRGPQKGGLARNSGDPRCGMASPGRDVR